MEARSQLRHRPTVLGDTTGCPLRTALSILADLVQIVNARDEPTPQESPLLAQSAREKWGTRLDLDDPYQESFRGDEAEDLAHHAVCLIRLK
jgi:hypothetical protein